MIFCLTKLERHSASLAFALAQRVSSGALALRNKGLENLFIALPRKKLSLGNLLNRWKPVNISFSKNQKIKSQNYIQETSQISWKNFLLKNKCWSSINLTNKLLQKHLLKRSQKCRNRSF